MPTYQYWCRGCQIRGDRYGVPVAERASQTCEVCGKPLTLEFVPTRSKPVVFANDSKYPSVFKGPKHRARYMKDHDLIPLDDPTPDGAMRHAQRLRKEADEAADREISQAVETMFEENKELIFRRGRDPGPARDPVDILRERHGDDIEVVAPNE